MSRQDLISSVIVMSIAACIAVPSLAPAATTLTEKATPLAAPEGVSAFIASPAGDRVAFLTIKLRKKTVVLDGNVGPAFDEVKTLSTHGPVLFSADGKHTAYLGRTGRSWSVVVDGKAGAEFDDVSEPRFSGDGLTVAYVGTSSEKATLVVVTGGNATTADLPGFAGGRELPELSADLKHFAYVATADGGATAIIDGKTSDKFNTIDKPAFSPDGAHCGFLAHADQDWIVLDGKKSGPFHDLSGLVFSADSRHWAAIQGAPGGGGPVMPPMPGDKPSAAPDKAGVVRDGKVFGSFDAVNAPLIFSPDGQRLAFVVDSGTGRAWHIDGDAQPSFQNVHTLVFSPDSKHFAYGAEASAGDVVVEDGKPGPTVNDVANDFALAFSPDSNHLAYVGVQDRAKVPMLDGTAVGGGSAAWSPTLAFSPDSHHLVAQDHKRVTIDGVDLKQPMLDSWPVVFDGGDQCHLIVTSAGQGRGRGASRDFVRVDVEIH